jgi:von Willebrand factor type A domain
MEAVKSSLQIMLRSLPSQNTTFNIVSFGSHYTSLWPKSRMYTAETVAHASKHVDTFTASYGGTEIRAALRFAFQFRLALTQNSSTEKPPSSVFVLTDGEAWDLNGVVEIVTENVEAAKKQNDLLRTFVLGVGNQVSTAMCEGIARAGKGSAVFVAVWIFTMVYERVADMIFEDGGEA